MAAQRVVAHEFQASPDEVAARVQDVDFLRRRSQRTTDASVEITIERVQDVVRVRTERDLSMDVPAFAKRLLGTTWRTIDVQNWRKHGDSWISDFSVEIAGIRAQARGQTKLSPAPNGCSYHCTFEISSRVPVVGGQIEELLATKLAGGLKQLAESTSALLSAERAAP